MTYVTLKSALLNVHRCYDGSTGKENGTFPQEKEKAVIKGRFACFNDARTLMAMYVASEDTYIVYDANSSSGEELAYFTSMRDVRNAFALTDIMQGAL